MGGRKRSESTTGKWSDGCSALGIGASLDRSSGSGCRARRNQIRGQLARACAVGRGSRVRAAGFDRDRLEQLEVRRLDEDLPNMERAAASVWMRRWFRSRFFMVL